jgi:hypothetical protein
MTQNTTGIFVDAAPTEWPAVRRRLQDIRLNRHTQPVDGFETRAPLQDAQVTDIAEDRTFPRRVAPGLIARLGNDGLEFWVDTRSVRRPRSLVRR